LPEVGFGGNGMDVRKIIAQLREERACIEEALVGIEKLLNLRAPRRGRPPLWLKPNGAAAAKQKENVAQSAP
jgi:hypothetical protein